MKDKCDYCGEKYRTVEDENDTRLRVLNEPMVYEDEGVSYHLECWVRKKWIEKGWAEEIDGRVCVFD